MGTTSNIWIENEQIKLSLYYIRDEKGEIIGYIDNNQLSIKKDTNYDFNFDSTALEITDPDNKVVLRVELKDGIAFIQGIFYQSDGGTFVFGPNLLQANPPGTQVEISFKPIFRHPGYKYKGQRLSPIIK